MRPTNRCRFANEMLLEKLYVQAGPKQEAIVLMLHELYSMVLILNLRERAVELAGYRIMSDI